MHTNTVFAWGTEGHQVIAQIAQSSLTPKATQAINRLLALESEVSLASISTWADEHKSKTTAPWHYINFPQNSCNYIPERDCKNGDCIVKALNKQIKTLKSNNSDQKKLHALKYVVHLMGDIHQPLHAGFGNDKGGNTYQIQAFGKGTNLHSVWDSGLIKNFHESTEQLSTRLLAKRKNTPESLDTNPVNIAIESCRIVQANDFYPQKQVDQAYIHQFTPVLEDRLLLGGQRLAQLLNQIAQ